MRRENKDMGISTLDRAACINAARVSLACAAHWRQVGQNEAWHISMRHARKWAVKAAARQ